MKVLLTSFFIVFLIVFASVGESEDSSLSVMEAKSILKSILGHNSNIHLVASSKLKELKVSPSPFLHQDFNGDGQRDLALNAVSTWREAGAARVRDAYFVVAAVNKTGKWEKVFSQKADSIAYPYMIWNSKKKNFYYRPDFLTTST